MAEYTHTFEINTNNQNIQGELSLNGGNKPCIKTSPTLDCAVEWEEGMHRVLKSVLSFSKVSGEINKIEIVRK